MYKVLSSSIDDQCTIYIYNEVVRADTTSIVNTTVVVFSVIPIKKLIMSRFFGFGNNIPK